jgi:hypothetical protein
MGASDWKHEGGRCSHLYPPRTLEVGNVDGLNIRQGKHGLVYSIQWGADVPQHKTPDAAELHRLTKGRP